jgi:hypothetical protein
VRRPPRASVDPRRINAEGHLARAVLTATAPPAAGTWCSHAEIAHVGGSLDRRPHGAEPLRIQAVEPGLHDVVVQLPGNGEHQIAVRLGSERAPKDRGVDQAAGNDRGATGRTEVTGGECSVMYRDTQPQRRPTGSSVPKLGEGHRQSIGEVRDDPRRVGVRGRTANSPSPRSCRYHPSRSRFASSAAWLSTWLKRDCASAWSGVFSRLKWSMSTTITNAWTSSPS